MLEMLKFNSLFSNNSCDYLYIYIKKIIFRHYYVEKAFFILEYSLKPDSNNNTIQSKQNNK